MKKPWTKEEDAQLLAALEADRTRRWIVPLAKQLGRTHQAVQHRLHELKDAGLADLKRR